MSEKEQTDHVSAMQGQEMVASSVSPMAWLEENHTTPITPQRQPSPFERLPIELREKFYGYLGFPLMSRVWVSSDDERVKSRADKWDSDDSDGSNESSSASTTQIQLVELDLDSPGQAQQVWRSAHSPSNNGPSDPTFEKSLLSVCRLTRADTLSMLYHKVPAHATDNFQIPREIHCSSYFAYITILRIGYNSWTSPYEPDVRTAKQRNGVLVKQIETLRFIAKRCVSLRTVRFHPALAGVPCGQGIWRWDGFVKPGLPLSLPKVKKSLVQSLASALALLARNCEVLECIEIPREVCTYHIRPNGRMLSMFERVNEGALTPTEEHTYKCALGGVAAIHREDTVKAWADEILDELVKKGPVYKLDVHPFPTYR